LHHLTLFGILWSLAISVGSAQEAATPRAESSPATRADATPAKETIPLGSKAIVLVIDADAQQSEVVKQVVEALEKAGIATGKTAETAPPAKSLISVTIEIRKDESWEKITTLIEALRNVGVQQISFRAGGVKAEGDEQNVLILNVHPGHTTDELHRIESAALTAAKKCGLPLVVVTKGREGTEAGEFFTPPEPASAEKRADPDSAMFGPTRRSIEDRPATANDSTTQINADPNQSRLIKWVVEGLKPAGIIGREPKDLVAANPEESFTVVVRASSDASSQSVLELIRQFKALGIRLFSIQSGDAGENFAIVIVGPRVPRELVERLRTEIHKLGASGTSPFRIELAFPSAIIEARTLLEASKQQVIAERVEMQRREVSSTDPRILRCEHLIADIDVKIRGVDKLILEQRFEPSVRLSNPEVLETKVFRLKRTQAASVVKNLEELIAGGFFRVVADERTNSLIMTGTPDQLQAAENLLRQMDEAAPAEPSTHEFSSKPPPIDISATDLQQQIAQFRTEYETGNKQAHDLAESLRQTPEAAKKAELRTVVQRAFKLRQSLLRAELLQMQSRLLETQRSIDMRERIADQIVDRRVEDLLNPQLGWEQNQTSVNESEGGTKHQIAATADAGRIDSSTPPGDSRATLLARLQGTWDVEVHSNEDPDGRLSAGMEMVCEIHGNQLVYLMKGESQNAYTIRFSEPATPQPIDLVEDQEGRKFRPGIIEITDALVRICLPNTANDLKRPDTFAFGNDTDIHVLRRPTELEGKWHWDSQPFSVESGTWIQVQPVNVTITGTRWSNLNSSTPDDCEFELNPKTKRINFKGRAPVSYSYELSGDRLVLHSESHILKLKRGHLRLPITVPEVTDAQRLRWRSGIVDIVVHGNVKALNGGSEVTIGRGVVVSNKGLIVTHLAGGWEHGINDWKIDAKFDDGSRVSLKIADDERGGILVLQPVGGAEINHFFPLATTLYSAGDEVYVGANDMNSPEHRTAIAKSRVILTDRRMATADSPVWQLEEQRTESLIGGQPVLSAAGELLGITLQNTGELLLAVPAEYLKLFFPKTLGQVEETEAHSVPGPGSATETPEPDRGEVLLRQPGRTPD